MDKKIQIGNDEITGRVDLTRRRDDKTEVVMNEVVEYVTGGVEMELMKLREC